MRKHPALAGIDLSGAGNPERAAARHEDLIVCGRWGGIVFLRTARRGQFIVVAVGATGFPAELVALALPVNAAR